MISVTQWWSQNPNKKPWLLLGKGPTFSRREEYPLDDFRLLSINHVVREMPVEVASIIDIDVVRECAAEIERNAQFLVMPRFPHVSNQPCERNLESYFDEIPVLKTFAEKNRLVWYNLASSTNVLPDSPVVPYGHFSGEVVTNLLAMLGAKKIRTLGIDGGQQYAAQFADLQKKKLNNGWPDFNVQNDGIARAIQKYDLDYGPLTSETPMRLYIGSDESQLLGARLLEYSVRRHSTITSQFDDMMTVKIDFPKEKCNQPRTGFSFNRFAIPKLAGYKGRAVYVDADMLVFRDFRDMWDTPFDGAQVLYAPSSDPKRVKQFSVLLLNCDELRWEPKEIVRGLDENQYDYDGLMKEFCIVPPDKVRATLPTDWNSLEEYHPGKTGLTHYTDMHLQPWVSRHNPIGYSWVNYLVDAVNEGFITQAELRDALQKGFIRPSLAWQIKLPRRTWKQFNRTFAKILDRSFAPHRTLAERLAS